MSSPLTIIASAWNFYKKQPVLNEIAFWMFFLPIAFIDALVGIAETVSAQGETGIDLETMTAMEIVIMIPIVLVLLFFLFWGQACVLTVCKRMVASPAGRNRTSFKAVRSQAKKFIGALFLTEILRGALTLLWSLLLIVPGIIYSIRTGFYGIMMVEEGKVIYGRETLKKSSALVKGHTWDIFWRMLVVGLIIFIPTALFSGGIILGLTAFDERLVTLGIVLTDFIESFVSVFYMICMVAIYADLKEAS